MDYKIFCCSLVIGMLLTLDMTESAPKKTKSALLGNGTSNATEVTGDSDDSDKSRDPADLDTVVFVVNSTFFHLVYT